MLFLEAENLSNIVSQNVGSKGPWIVYKWGPQASAGYTIYTGRDKIPMRYTVLLPEKGEYTVWIRIFQDSKLRKASITLNNIYHSLVGKRESKKGFKWVKVGRYPLEKENKLAIEKVEGGGTFHIDAILFAQDEKSVPFGEKGVAALSTVRYSPNQLTVDDFEDGIIRWYPSSSKREEDVGISTDTPSGKYCIRFHPSTIDKFFVFDWLPLKEGIPQDWSRYKWLRFKMKTDDKGIGAKVGFRWYDREAGWVKWLSVTPKDTEWREYVMDISSLPRKKVTRLVFYTPTTPQRKEYSVWIDDIELLSEYKNTPSYIDTSLPSYVNDSFLQDQMKILRGELRKARKEGYDITPVERLLSLSSVEKEGERVPVQRKLEYIRRAKGMLISLRMPTWSYDIRLEPPKKKVIPPKDNVALLTKGTTYRVSTEIGNGINDGWAALDGDKINPESYWAGEFGSGAPQTLELDFNRKVSIYRNVIYWYSLNIRGVAYKLEYWDDRKKKWELIYEEENNQKKVAEYSFPPVSTSRIRFTMFRFAGQNRVVMREFELYGKELEKKERKRITSQPYLERNLSLRDVVFLSRRWGIPWSVARPSVSLSEIENYHRRGRKVAFYIEGALSPTTMILLPGRVKWRTPFSNQYANAYWRDGKEWWGFSGTFLEHQEWIAKQIELLARMGFDGGYIDSALSSKNNAYEQNVVKNTQALRRGGWIGIERVIKKYPHLVVGLNNFGNSFIDDPVLKYNMPAMYELKGRPLSSEFYEEIRRFARENFNAPLWCWLSLRSSLRKYTNLVYGVLLAHKINLVSSGINPDPEFQIFAREFSLYILNPANELFVSQERLEVFSSDLKYVLLSRKLLSGKTQLVAHLFNLSSSERKNVEISMDTEGILLPTPLKITYLTPGNEPIELKYKKNLRGLRFTLPYLKTWGVLVVGAPVFPSIESRFIETTSSFTFSLQVKNFSGRKYLLSFLVPERWKIYPAKMNLTEESQSVQIKVAIPEGYPEGLYAITPVLEDEFGNRISTLPTQVRIVPPLSFVWDPPYISSPSRKEQLIKLRVSNNTDKRIKTELEIKPCQGILEEGINEKVELPPRQSSVVEVRVKPEISDINLWGFRDVYLKVSWRSSNRKGTANVPLRLFPAPFRVYPGDILKIFRVNEYSPWGFPQLIFSPGGIKEALEKIDKGEYCMVWIDEYNARDFSSEEIKVFLKKGGGMVLTSTTYSDTTLLPVEPGKRSLRKKLILLRSPITEPIFRLKREFEGEFKVMEVQRVKKGGKVIATWEDGSPAIVISEKHGKRIAFVGSRLEGDYTFGKRGEKFIEENWQKNLWLITGLYNQIFRWTVGIGQDE